MKQQLQEIRENQKSSWNKFSPGWKKWDKELHEHMQAATDGIIRLLDPKGAQIILDIAAGTGEPGFNIATLLPEGKVVITDLAEDMLVIAREKALHIGIKNVEFLACDVCELPFEDNSFDGVSCRMGFMFFPDMLLAAKEIFRVLKPGGKLATAVWNKAEKNFWITAMSETINRYVQLPSLPPGAPGILRCSESGLMTSIFDQAGFKNISENEAACELKSGTAEIYWEMMTEIAAPVVSALSKVDELTKDKIKKEVFDIVNQKNPSGNVVLDGSCLLIYGEK